MIFYLLFTIIKFKLATSKYAFPGNTYVYSSQGQTIKYKCKDRDRQNKNQIKKACHTT